MHRKNCCHMCLLSTLSTSLRLPRYKGSFDCSALPFAQKPCFDFVVTIYKHHFQVGVGVDTGSRCHNMVQFRERLFYVYFLFPKYFSGMESRESENGKEGETRIRLNGYNMNHKNDELLNAPFLFLTLYEN